MEGMSIATDPQITAYDVDDVQSRVVELWLADFIFPAAL